ncbi:hypothetical protein ACHAXR_000812 [Thalassiosira sp. AJA248-18]
MTRVISIVSVALLGFTTIASGFSAPKSTNTASARQHVSRPALFPVPHNRATCPSESIIATQMTKSEEEKTEEATTSSEAAADATEISAKESAVDTTTTAAAAKDDSKNRSAFSLILLPTLLFKFTIVLCVKFATDIVVFPLLWMYRLARMGKRKLMRGIKKLFGKKDNDGGVEVRVNGSVNGDASSTAESS